MVWRLVLESTLSYDEGIEGLHSCGVYLVLKSIEFGWGKFAMLENVV